MFYKNAEPCD